MRKIYLTAIIILATNTGFAQVNAKVDDIKKSLETENKDTVAWMYSGNFVLGFNEGFLHNWPAGGELGSITTNSLFSVTLVYFNHSAVWTNNLELAYGLNYAYSTGFLPHKTDDRINFTSKYGTKVKNSKNIYLTGLFNFKSQFTKGYDYTQKMWDTTSTSKFLSPAYFTLALGFEYRKGSDFNVFFSPLAARVVLVDKYYTDMSPTGAFGVPYGKSSVFQLGAYMSANYGVDITKKTRFKTRVDLYMNYLAKDTKDSTGVVIKKDNPGNIDIYWDNMLTCQLYKRLALSFGITLVYDNDIPYKDTYVDNTGATVKKDEPGTGLGWWQINQIFTLGVQYKF